MSGPRDDLEEGAFAGAGAFASPREQLAFDDDRIYEWEIVPAAAPRLAWMTMPVSFLGIGAGTYGIAWLIGLLSQEWATWLASAGAVICFLTSLWALARSIFGNSAQGIEGATVARNAAVMSIALLMYALVTGAGSEDFANVESAGPGQWALYLIDNALIVILADLPEVYAWSLSEIQAKTEFGQLVGALVRVLITLGVIDVAIRVVRAMTGDNAFFGTVADMYWQCMDVQPVGSVARRVAHVVPDEAPLEFDLEQVLEAFREEGEKTSIVND